MFHPQPTQYSSLASYGLGPGFLYPRYHETPLDVSVDAGTFVGGGSHHAGGGIAAVPGAACGSSGSFVFPASPGPASAPYSSGSGPAPTAAGPTPAATAPFAPTSYHANANSAHPASSTSSSSHTGRRNHSARPHLVLKMEPEHDLAAQEAAAREYQPQLEGPLVGQKTTSHAITDEYARADPIYVQKTMALPETYSHYRPIQGDGNCGWRAIGFGYFETLIMNGDRAQVEAELQRLTQLNDYIAKVGGFSEYFLDMVEETFLLLGKISETIDDQEEALAALLESFNDVSISSHIVYHLRLLASSWLKGNAEAYENFIPVDAGLSLAGYCESVLERHGKEIDHLGIVLLVNVLLKPAGFVLEVAYLDRSPGVQVNTYRIPEDCDDQDMSGSAPIIYLLYRPEHYDILYRTPIEIQVHRATSFTHEHVITSSTSSLQNFSSLDMGTLALIPGFVAPSAEIGVFGGDAMGSSLDFTPSPDSPWMPSPYAAEPLLATPTSPQPPPLDMTGLGGATISVSPGTQLLPPEQSPHPLRFSEYCQMPKYVKNRTWREPTLVTNSFKNSHFNVAHYNNPNFQPEEYKPDADEAEAAAQHHLRPRKRGSGS